MSIPSFGGGSSKIQRRKRHSLNQLTTPTVLEQRVDTKTPSAGQRRTWVARTGTIYCENIERPASYVSQGGQLIMETIHRVTVRYIAGVTGGSSWRFNGPYGIWYITAAYDPDDDLHWLETVCREVPG